MVMPLVGLYTFPCFLFVKGFYNMTGRIHGWNLKIMDRGVFTVGNLNQPIYMSSFVFGFGQLLDFSLTN